jgi:ribosomal protein S18 acetylase RimI-like enzyme
VVSREGQCSVPDPMILKIWEAMIQANAVQTTFYDQAVISEKGFIDYVKNPNNCFFLAVDVDRFTVIGFLWINNYSDGVGYIHFCALHPFIFVRREVARDLLLYAKRIGIFQVLIGITPESYESAIEIVKKNGFTVIGKIPKICNMAYENRREAGVISYLSMEEYYG